MNEAISRKRERIYLSLIMVLGAILRLVRLGHQSFWWDEVYSANLAAKSLGIVVPRFGQTPTLYHILLHFWLYLGRSDTVIRLLSALFGIAVLWVIYLLGKQLLNAKQGLLCALLMAISPFHIWYSQEARMYSLLILLSTASMLFFIKLLQEYRTWPAIWWAVTTGLAIYTHYYAAFIPICQLAFSLLFLNKHRDLGRRFILYAIALAIMTLPIFYMFFRGERFSQLCTAGAGGNPIRFFSIPYTFFAFSLGFSYGPSTADLHRSSSLATVQPYLNQILPAALVFAVLFVLGLRSAWREREKLILLLMWFLVPILGASLASFIWPQISYNVRYVSVALPAYVFILARGLWAPGKRVIKWALTMLIFMVMFFSLYNHYFQGKYSKEDYRSAAQLVTTYSRDGDVILVTHLMPFKHYYRGSIPARSFFWSPAFYRGILTMQLHGYHRAWFVLSREWGSDPEGRMTDYMKSTFPAVRETTLANLYLGLFDLASTGKNPKATVLRRKGG